MPISLRLPPDVEKRLTHLAKVTGRSKTYYALQAIREHLDDLEDLYLAEQELKEVRAGRSRTFTLDDAERELGLMPEKQEMSIVEAANFLNVSRPFVIKEIKAGRLAYRMVGTHRRIAFSDLVEYAKAMQKRRLDALDRMAVNAAKLGLE